MTLRDEIESRGHWSVRLRPPLYAGDRLNYGDLLPILRRSRVQLTGWDFPHVSNESEAVGETQNVVGFDTDWFYYRELVRFWQSGQVFYLGGIREDWYERGSPTMWRPPTVEDRGSLLGLADTVTRFTEIYAFAARLASSLPGVDGLVITVGLYGLRGRRLYSENPARWIAGQRTATIDRYEYEDLNDVASLAGDDGEIAAIKACELLLRFNTDIAFETMREIQAETRRVR